MLKNINELETVQQEEWNRVEEKVESTLAELKNIRQDNENMMMEIENLTKRNEDLQDKILDLRTKYKVKKNENFSLKEKCIKLTHSLAQVENENSEMMQYFSLKEKQENKIQKKLKVRIFNY